MKHKQVYFVEYNNETIKFNGFDALDQWIEKREKEEKWKVFSVQAIMDMCKK